MLDAMTISRMVIMIDVPSCWETMEDGINEFLVSVHDEQLLAEAWINRSED